MAAVVAIGGALDLGGAVQGRSDSGTGSANSIALKVKLAETSEAPRIGLQSGPERGQRGRERAGRANSFNGFLERGRERRARSREGLLFYLVELLIGSSMFLAVRAASITPRPCLACVCFPRS